MHRFVVGEIACASLNDRSAILQLLRDLPAAVMAQDEEVLGFVERPLLYGKGIGYIDAHLLAAAALTKGAGLWTRDRRLRMAAEDLDCAFRDSSNR
jgi:predicted nucleic acid-binding protein